MKFAATEIADVALVEPDVHGDDRGFFFEAWRADEMAAAGLPGPWVQDNHSRSTRGVLRGIHYQIAEPQGKLVRVVRGAVFDVAVDLRRSSPDFGRWVGRELSAHNKRMLWLPPGFGHGFLTLSDEADLVYKCTAYYAPEHDRTIAWDDPDIAIAWPTAGGARPTLSAKDDAGSRLRDAETYP